MQLEQQLLSNGLETIFINSPGATAGTVQIWFRAGSALEKESNQGIAHFLEHMFFKGTKKRPGAKIARDVESFGGEVNAFTSFDYTCYYINTPSSQMGETIDILLDMVSNPRFLLSDLKPEREVVFEEYRRSQDNPNQYSFQQIQKSCFEKGYKHPILGTEKTIKKFSQKQLRDFRLKYYNLSNAFLVVAGDLEKKDKLVKQITKYKLPKGPESQFPEFDLKKKSSCSVHTKDVRMGQLTLCSHAAPMTSDLAPPEDLAISCLGHGETSRLYRNLVLKESIANTSSASTMFFNHGGIHFQRVIFPMDSLDKVLDDLYSVYREISEKGFTEDEVKKIKNQYVASKIYEMESLESFAFSVGHGLAQTGNIFSEEQFINKIKNCSKKKVDEGFRRILSKPLHLSMQIPKGCSSPEIKGKLQAFIKKVDKLSPSKTKVATVQAGGGSKFDKQVTFRKIKDGISLLHRKNEVTPTFVLHGYIKGGLADESLENNGSYHLISSLMTSGFEGKTRDEVKSIFEDRSANINGFSGKNAYGLTLHGQTEDFPTLSDAWFKSLLVPDFPESEFEHEKQMALRQLENQTEDPVRQCFHRVNNLMFNGHPYSYNILGSEDNLNKLNADLLKDIHKSNLQEKEILFTYCGDLPFDDVREVIEKHIESLRPRSSRTTQTKKFKPEIGQQEYLNFDREQTQIFIGFPTSGMTSRENIYLKMLTSHLSGQSSELFVDVRDRKGLCYSVQPLHFTALEAGYWGIYMASGHDKVKDAIHAIEEILGRIQQKAISKREFDRVKKMIEGQTLVNIQTNDDYASIYSVPALHGLGVDFFYNRNNDIKSLKYEDFKTKIKSMLGRKWNKVIVGRSI